MKESNNNGNNHSDEFIVVEDFMNPHKRPNHLPDSGIEFVPLNRPPQPAEQPPEPKKQVSPKKKLQNKYYTRAGVLFSLFFFMLIGYMVYFNIMLSDSLRMNPNNSKGDISESYVTRGTIYDNEGNELAYTYTDEMGGETRIYPYGAVYSHVVGYTDKGKSGIEAAYNTALLTSSSSVRDRVGSEAHNQKQKGDSVYLTLDTQLQQAAYNALGNNRGAIVVMEPKSGKILAMVSKPGFDPNELSSMWDYLMENDEDSPLLNRATQGLYPPGSTFKILTALEYIKEHPNDYMYYHYDCYGSFTDYDVLIKCYDYEQHGSEDLQASFQHSCNTSFANIGLNLDLKKFEDLAGFCMFNDNLPLQLPYSKSRFYLNENSSYGEIMTTSIGQGNTLVSPFHMALIVSAIANKGRLMNPYLVDHIENAENIMVKSTKASVYKELMTPTEASILRGYMRSVVEGGTASALWNSDYTVAGKTGSAEYVKSAEEEFSTHSWFVGFSNVDDPDITVSIIVEDGGTGSASAVPIAQQIFNSYYYGW